MTYVIQSTKMDRSTGKEYTFYFKGETMFGAANSMTNLEQAHKYETKTEATRVKRMRFGSAKTVKVVRYDTAK